MNANSKRILFGLLSVIVLLVSVYGLILLILANPLGWAFMLPGIVASLFLMREERKLNEEAIMSN
ncbi:MAG: hypothetical protein QXG05_02705 [Nitrososphaerota archaeon]